MYVGSRSKQEVTHRKPKSALNPRPFLCLVNKEEGSVKERDWGGADEEEGRLAWSSLLL